MTLRPVTLHGRQYWRVDFGLRSGRRTVRHYATRKAADRAIADDTRDCAQIGRRWADLPAVRRHELLTLLDEMARAGVTLQQVWDAFRQERMRPRANVTPISSVLTDYMASKRKANRRLNYIKGLEHYLQKFCQGREQQPIHAVSPADVESWIGAKGTPSSQQSNYFKLRGLFEYARRRGYIKSNPCDAVERISVEVGRPQILTLQQVMKALEYAKEHMDRFLPYLVLALFAGIRPEEIDRLSWKDVNKARGIVTIGPAASKLRRRRVVNLEPNAVAWLRLGGDLPLPAMTRRRCVRKLRDHLGLKVWPKDVLRKTAASMLLAYKQNDGYVSLQLDHSRSTLFRHYREVVSQEDARRFFDIYPKATTGSKPLPTDPPHKDNQPHAEAAPKRRPG